MTTKPQLDDTHVNGNDLAATTPAKTADAGESSWLPTRKWITNLLTGLAGIVGSWIVTGEFDDVERGLTALLLGQLAATYFVPNQPTPGGVPEA